MKRRSHKLNGNRPTMEVTVQRTRTAYEMWHQGHSQAAIAAAIGITQPAVSLALRRAAAAGWPMERRERIPAARRVHASRALCLGEPSNISPADDVPVDDVPTQFLDGARLSFLESSGCFRIQRLAANKGWSITALNFRVCGPTLRYAVDALADRLGKKLNLGASTRFRAMVWRGSRGYSLESQPECGGATAQPAADSRHE